jgi:arylsulfatase A-like enzyme
MNLQFFKAKYNMTTFDEDLVKAASDFMDKAKKEGKPFFIWHNTTRMHVWTFLSKKYSSMENAESNYGLEEAGMAQLDDDVGALLKHPEDTGEADNTIVIFTTDNGAAVFTWPEGGMTPLKSAKGTVGEGGFRVPCITGGRVTSNQALLKMASSPVSTGSRPCWQRREIRASPTNSSKG